MNSLFIFILLLISAASAFSQSPDSLYPVKVYTADGYKYGYINSEGYLSIKPQYAFARDFNNGRAFVKNDINSDIWLCINTTGKTVFELKAKYLYDYRYNQAKVLSTSDSVCYIDLNGKPTEWYIEISSAGDKYPATFIDNNKYGYKADYDKILLPAIYERAGEFSEGLAPVFIKFKESDLPEDNCYNAFINEKGDVIIRAELKYDEKGYLESGYFYSPGKWQNGICRYFTSNDPLTRVEKYIRSDGKIIW
jgi:hypothetical protein